MKWLTIAVVFLILGIGIGFWIASNRPKPQKVTLAFSSVGDLFLKADPTDVITWDKKGSGARFKHKIPCAEGKPGDTISTCTVTATGVYMYDCEGCQDPGIAIGTDVIMIDRSKGGSPIVPDSYAKPKNPEIYCDLDTKEATATPITSAPPGSIFQFYPEGGFTVTFLPGTCEQGDVLTNQASVCTVKMGAKNQPSYPITLKDCKDGTGSLKVQ